MYASTVAKDCSVATIFEMHVALHDQIGLLLEASTGLQTTITFEQYITSDISLVTDQRALWSDARAVTRMYTQLRIYA